MVVPTDLGIPAGKPTSFARTFVCLQAVWQGLQAYPVPGTQSALGTFLLILAYSICLQDAVKIFVEDPWIIGRLGTLGRRPRLAFQALLLVALVLLGTDWFDTTRSWGHYRFLPSLALRGSAYIHAAPQQVELYSSLVRYIEDNSDACLSFSCDKTVPSFNSIYFWTGRTPPGYYTSATVLGDYQQQEQMVKTLLKANHPIIILNEPSPATVTDLGKLFVHPSGPLIRLIRDQSHEVKRIGNFRILQVEKSRG